MRVPALGTGRVEALRRQDVQSTVSSCKPTGESTCLSASDHVSCRYSRPVSDQYAAARRPRQADRARRGHHPRRHFAAEIYRGVLDRRRLTHKKPRRCAGAFIGQISDADQPAALASRRRAVQDEFGVAVRLLAALEDQIAGRLEGDAVECRAPSAGTADRPAFCPSTTTAMRFSVSITCSLVTTP